MARKRNSENEIVVSTGAAPARRKTSATRPRRAVVTPKVETVAAPETPVAAEPVTASTPYVPAHEEIAALAYSYWVARGYQGGSQEEDWIRAEQELRSR